MDSLFNDEMGKCNKEIRESLFSKLQWIRIQDCYSKKQITIAENIKPEDVSQGQIGDWYLMAVLSALAAFHPQIISDIFVTDRFNEAGIYAMKVYINGHRQVIVIDDFIPCYKFSKTPAFARKEILNIWPILIEKAWAKVCGWYEGIISGNSKEALEFLLPYPIETMSFKYSLESRNDIWNKIHKAIEQSHIILCSGNKDGKDEAIEPEEKIVTNIGLITNHAYAVTGIYRFPYHEKDIWLIKILNPWNSQEFKGRWHDGDERWWIEIMNYVNFYEKTEGEFFIPLTTFCSFFNNINICKIDLSLQSSTIQLSHKKNSFWLAKVKLNEPSRLTLKIIQIIKRVFSEHLSYKPSHWRILIGRLKENFLDEYEYVYGDYCRLETESLTIEVQRLLRSGTYIVHLELDWNNEHICTFSLIALAKNLTLEEASEITHPNFLKNCLTNYAQNLPAKQ